MKISCSMKEVMGMTKSKKYFSTRNLWTHKARINKIDHGCEIVIELIKNKPDIIFLDAKMAFEASYTLFCHVIKIPHPKFFLNSDKYYFSLFHELIHATGHRSGLNRSSISQAGALDNERLYQREEFTATIGSYLICKHFGMDVYEDAASYITHWVKHRVKNTTQKNLREARKEAIKAAKYILS